MILEKLFWLSDAKQVCLLLKVLKSYMVTKMYINWVKAQVISVFAHHVLSVSNALLSTSEMLVFIQYVNIYKMKEWMYMYE